MIICLNCGEKSKENKKEFLEMNKDLVVREEANFVFVKHCGLCSRIWGGKRMLGDYDVCKYCGKRGFFEKNICEECYKEYVVDEVEKCQEK